MLDIKLGSTKNEDGQSVDRLNETFCPPRLTDKMYRSIFSPTSNGATSSGSNASRMNSNSLLSDEDFIEQTTKYTRQDDTVDLFPTEKWKTKPLPSTIPIEAYKSLSPEMKMAVQKMHTEVNANSKRSGAVEHLVKLISETKNIDVTNMALILSNILRDSFSEHSFPTELNESTAIDSINKSFFLLYQGLLKFEGNNSSKNTILLILSEMRAYQPRIGYLLLYYLQVKNIYPYPGSSETKLDNKFSFYKDLCHARERKFEECLLSDLQVCQVLDMNLFLWLIPVIYQTFSRFAVNNDQLLRLVLSCVSPIELQDFAFKIVRGQLMMFDHDAFTSLVSSSLSWESFEQFFFWQLVEAHNISLECMLNSLPKLDFTNHSEAVTCIMLLLKRQKPSANFLKPLFCRELKPTSDSLVSTVLYHWCTYYTEETANIISDLITSRCPATSPNKRKRGQGQGLGSRTGVSPPSAERILGHLDKVGDDCKRLFQEESMQKALKIAHNACTDTQKQLYSNLFDQLKDEEQFGNQGGGGSSSSSTTSSSSGSSSTTTANGSIAAASTASTTVTAAKGRGRRPNNVAALTSTNSNSPVGKRHAITRSSLLKEIDITGDSSDEEEIIKPRTTKRRKKLTMSDSD